MRLVHWKPTKCHFNPHDNVGISATACRFLADRT